MFRGFVRTGALLALWVFGLIGNATAQTVTGTITGTVLDPSGAIVPGAQVVVKDEGTGSERPASTNAEGSFVVVGLPPGRYAIQVEMRGFRPITRSGLILTASQRLSIGTIELAVGQT